jgi:hypothetical protein
MRYAFPVITKAAEILKARLPLERDGRTRARLPRLYLLANGQAQTRQEAAQWLGVHRHAVGHGLVRDVAGSLAALLTLYGPPGEPGCST